ncbi:MAG: RsmD family RNA methyltransferase, partial [Shewanella sp.]
DTLAVLQQGCEQEQGFDIVFIDPPFRKDLAQKTIQLLDSQGWLNDGALIYVEIESELTHLTIPAHWHTLKEKTAGQVSYRLYQYQQDSVTIEEENHAVAN